MSQRDSLLVTALQNASFWIIPIIFGFFCIHEGNWLAAGICGFLLLYAVIMVLQEHRNSLMKELLSKRGLDL